MKWAEQVQDRLKWKDIVEKAKTIRVVAPQQKKILKGHILSVRAVVTQIMLRGFITLNACALSVKRTQRFIAILTDKTITTFDFILKVTLADYM